MLQIGKPQYCIDVHVAVNVVLDDTRAHYRAKVLKALLRVFERLERIDVLYDMPAQKYHQTAAIIACSQSVGTINVKCDVFPIWKHALETLTFPHSVKLITAWESEEGSCEDCWTSTGSSQEKVKDQYTESRKRPLQRQVTPPEVEAQLKKIKATLKSAYVRAGLTKEGQTLLPPCAIKFINPNAQYKSHTQLFDDERLNALMPADLNGLNEFVTDVANSFMEAIVKTSSVWIIITQFDVFLQVHGDLDTCAHRRKSQYSREIEASLTPNAYSGSSTWHELRLQWGDVQILVLGAIYGYTDNDDSTAAFLGPACPIKKAPDETFDVYILERPAEVFRIERQLRDYNRPDALNRWGFYSKRFATAGFRPAHPLYFGSHPKASKNPSLSTVASYTLATWVSKQTTKEHIARALQLLARTEEFQPLFAQEKGRIQDVLTLKTAMRDNKFNATEYNLFIVDRLSKMEKELQKSEPVNMLLAYADSQQARLYDFMNMGLAEAIRTVNKNTAKAYIDRTK